MGPCGLDPHPRPRRSRTRRGRGAGCLHDRPGALAARRHPRKPRSLDRHHCPEPCDRPDQARAGLRAQGRAAGATGVAARRGGRRELDPRRPPLPRLHLLSPRPRRGGPRRADAPRGRRPDDDRDRTRLPRRRADDGAKARPREAEDPRCRDPVPRPTRPRAPRAASLGALRPVSRLQRGLLGERRRRACPRRPLRGGDPARQAACRPDARRGGGTRPARADALPRRAAGHTHSRRRHDRLACRAGSTTLELGSDRRGSTRPRAGDVAPKPRPVPDSRRRSARSTSRRDSPRTPTGLRSPASTQRSPAWTPRRSSR